jgi:hypothetical protein
MPCIIGYVEKYSLYFKLYVVLALLVDSYMMLCI